VDGWKYLLFFLCLVETGLPKGNKGTLRSQKRASEQRGGEPAMPLGQRCRSVGKVQALALSAGGGSITQHPDADACGRLFNPAPLAKRASGPGRYFHFTKDSISTIELGKGDAGRVSSLHVSFKARRVPSSPLWHLWRRTLFCRPHGPRDVMLWIYLTLKKKFNSVYLYSLISQITNLSQSALQSVHIDIPVPKPHIGSGKTPK